MATTLRTPRQTVKKQPNRFLEIFNPSVTTCHLPYILRCKTQRRRVILSYISCLFFSLAVSRSITGCCVSHIEKVARSDGGVEKHHLNQSVYIRYLTPSPYTPPISPAMSRGRIHTPPLCFCSAKIGEIPKNDSFWGEGVEYTRTISTNYRLRQNKEYRRNTFWWK